ncbi:threonine dehydrogenase-like Zn-dependent dehydrogenase [Isoptericola variabilis J7]|uniref:Alcohol dehydrogenase GroES domain protein n=1 Tax=Isoptericola variabilis (strain 225) TaxID=743718 RepID=F6FTR0_ISOV2|nr:Alcohol dehydrogenase GroES domain protein [Isoptericola variabilis 225]TWH28498.1 threonine dehydrogenase-like Zn-dependent dehydrogenase [Isoptericola variabilis J7]
MRALTVVPGQAGSLAVTDVPDVEAGPGELLVDGLAVGICGTDAEIAAGEYGSAPPGRERLVLGHESLGRVARAPAGSGFAPGDLVVGVVRRPDPVPCGACARGEWDMCRNGRYTEHGIKDVDGFASERWVIEADRAVRLDPALADVGMLLEPTSVVAKAWEQVDAVGGRAWFEPRTALVTGAGPIGLLAALIGVQRGLDVHVLDRHAEGRKPDLVGALGATYHTEDLATVSDAVQPEVLIEATGAPPVITAALTATRPYGVTVLTGVTTPGRTVPLDVGAANREIVLENDAIVGSVNANMGHYEAAADVLARADLDWLRGLVTRRLPLERALEAFDDGSDDVKVVVELSA